MKCSLILLTEHPTFKDVLRLVTGVNKKLGKEDGEAQMTRLLVRRKEGFPGGAVVENLPANAGDTGSSPGLGRSRMLRSN